MEDFFAFRRMVTPLIIQILFWIGVVIVVISGLVLIFVGSPTLSRPEAIGTGLLILALGPIGVRVYAELLIIVFRINETLTDIREQLARGEGPAEPA